MSAHETQKENSAAEFALAKSIAEIERVSALYESVAMRVIQLELAPKETQQYAAQSGNSADALSQDRSPPRGKKDWLRILRHMTPKKLRVLLAEHDTFPHMQSEMDQLRDERQQLLAKQETFEKTQQALEEAQGELQRLRTAALYVHRQARRQGAIRSHGERTVAENMPEFPKAIFHAAASSKIRIVDVGAQDLVSEDHIYAPLQLAGETDVIGFEPLQDSEAARRRADPNVKLLKYFVGTGDPGIFHITHFDPASSLFKANSEFLSQFVALPTMCNTISSFEVKTTRLDDVFEIADCDFLKIDVQGGELDVLRGAQKLLEKVVTIHCEVEFGPVYCDQPLFSEIDSFLRANGFELIDLMNAGYNRYNALPWQPDTGSRLLWAEGIYFKMPQILKQDAKKFLKAAYIAHANYGMLDLAANFLAEYDKVMGHSMLDLYAANLRDWIDRRQDI